MPISLGTILRHILDTSAVKKLKIDIFMRNFDYHHFHTYNCFQNLPFILSKLFQDHIGGRGRRQYNFETNFGHKSCEKAKNRHTHVKFPLSPEISIWRAVSASAHTYNFFQNLPLIFSKLFHDHIRLRGRRQYLFETYFGHKGCEKLKMDIFMWNLHYHQKYRFGAWCRCPRTPTIAFKTYPSYFQSCFMII